jgi:hypothetical protein
MNKIGMWIMVLLVLALSALVVRNCACNSKPADTAWYAEGIREEQARREAVVMEGLSLQGPAYTNSGLIVDGVDLERFWGLSPRPEDGLMQMLEAYAAQGVE